MCVSCDNMEENQVIIDGDPLRVMASLGNETQVVRLGMFVTSAKGLRLTAEYIEKCLGKGDHTLMHTAHHYPDGRVVAGLIIPEREPK